MKKLAKDIIPVAAVATALLGAQWALLEKIDDLKDAIFDGRRSQAESVLDIQKQLTSLYSRIGEIEGQLSRISYGGASAYPGALQPKPSPIPPQNQLKQTP